MIRLVWEYCEKNGVRKNSISLIALLISIFFFFATNILTARANPSFEGSVRKFCPIKNVIPIFIPKVFSLHGLFPPLWDCFCWEQKSKAKRVRGWNFENLLLFHPPTPTSGREISCKSLNCVQKINALKFAKRELNHLSVWSPASRGREVYFKFSSSVQKEELNHFIFKEKHKEIIQDSTYRLLQTIPTKSTYLTTDNLQNLYVATEQGQITKFDKNGKKQFEYNNNRLGQVGKIAVQNPLNILVYYPDLAVIIILDRTLSEIKELNLYDLDIISPKGIALANDNNIWVYDEVTALLKKLSPEGKVLFESRNLNQLVQKQLQPSFLEEKNNQVYLSDPQNGLFIFDAFGQLKQAIPIKSIDQFQVLQQQLLIWKEEQTYLLNQPFAVEQLLTLPTTSTKPKMISISGKLMYIGLENEIAIYLQDE